MPKKKKAYTHTYICNNIWGGDCYGETHCEGCKHQSKFCSGCKKMVCPHCVFYNSIKNCPNCGSDYLDIYPIRYEDLKDVPRKLTFAANFDEEEMDRVIMEGYQTEVRYDDLYHIVYNQDGSGTIKVRDIIDTLEEDGAINADSKNVISEFKLSDDESYIKMLYDKKNELIKFTFPC